MSLDWPPETLDSLEDYARYATVYDLLYGGRSEDIQFYVKYAIKYTGPMLEVGCGSGRLTLALAKIRKFVTAIDNSPEMLALCRKRIRGKIKDHVTLVLEDARQLNLSQKFDLIVAPFAMVAHLYSNQDRMKFFRSVFRHLEPKGLFILDDANRTTWESSKKNECLEWKRQVTDPNTGTIVRMLSNYFYDDAHPIIVRYDFIDWLKGERIMCRKILRVAFRYTVVKEDVRFLKRAGFGSVQVLGDWDENPFNFKHPEENNRVILMASNK